MNLRSVVGLLAVASSLWGCNAHKALHGKPADSVTEIAAKASIVPDEAAADSLSVYLGLKNSNDTLPKPAPVAITEAQFKKYAKNYHSDIDSTESRITRTPREIQVETVKQVIHFAADTTDYGQFSYYKGYFPRLKAHIVDEVNADNEVSCMVLIDSLSGKTYWLEAVICDNSVEIPLPSPGYKYLLAYANDLYRDSGSFISIMKISKGKGFEYTEHSGYTFKDKRVAGIAWIDDASFALKLVPRDENDKTPAAYYRIRLREK